MTPAGVAADLWSLAGLPADALQRLDLPPDQPLFPSSFQVALAAQTSIGVAALAASEVWRQRGHQAEAVSVPQHAAERECTTLFTINGAVPPSWAPHSGLYPCRDGFVRIHANFDHHRDAALQVLGLTASASRAAVTDRLAGWDRMAFETAALAAGGAVAACRSPAEWQATPQAAEIANGPLFSIDRIGDADPLPLPPNPARPLAKVRVLDLTRILAGPLCGRTLAAYGAEVLLVNAPTLPNIEHIIDTSRGKRSCHIDLDTAEGRQTMQRLAGDAHILVQGYRPGALARRGLSPEALAERRPGIICVSLSAYGPGPWHERRGFDSLVQTATGINVAEAEAAGADTPRALPYQILDCASGFLMAFAAQAALLRQQAEGGSWHVQVSLAQTGHWLWGLGRRAADFSAAAADLTGALQPWPCEQGDLMAMPHAATLGGTPCTWSRPSVPPGTHPARWESAGQ